MRSKSDSRPSWGRNARLSPGRIDDFRHLEDGQKHADDDAAHDYAQENDQQRLNERSQTGECRFDFLVKKVCHALEHRVNFAGLFAGRSEEHTSELQSQSNLVCRLLLEKKKKDRNV